MKPGRKFWFAFAVEVVATLALFLHSTDAAGIKHHLATFVEWADFTKWLLGIYVIGNVGTKLSARVQINGSAKAQG
jgi:hypothetical protein